MTTSKSILPYKKMLHNLDRAFGLGVHFENPTFDQLNNSSESFFQTFAAVNYLNKLVHRPKGKNIEINRSNL